jgi:hypothetical protein
MIKEYIITEHNSTVNGLPGRRFKWAKFCWNGKETYIDRYRILDGMPSRLRAPLPLVDNYLIAKGCEYLHVPYNWKKDCTIYRVRPNVSMYAGRVYRKHLILAVKAIKRDNRWYWSLELE